jgi:hypothetical protein
VQRYLNTVDVVASLYDPAVTRLRTGKSAGSPSLEELLGTSHLRARCEPLYHQVLVFLSLPLGVLKLRTLYYLCTLM